MPFSKSFYFSIVFSSICLPSVYMDSWKGFLSKKWTGMDRGKEGVEKWGKCADTHYGRRLWL